MARVRLSDGRGGAAPPGLLAVPVTDRREIATADLAPDGGLGSELSELLRAAPSFAGEPGELVSLITNAAGRRALLAVGIGPRDPHPDVLRTAAMALGRAARDHHTVETTLAALGPDPVAAVRAVAEGFLAGCYRYSAAGPGTAGGPEPELVLALPAETTRRGDVHRALAVALVAADATTWARQLVDAPASQVNPDTFAQAIRQRAESAGVRVQVWAGEALRARGFGGTLGVGAAGSVPPAVVELTACDGDGARLGLVGKGITFDSGGLNLKRDPAEIRWMKSDMAGAAAVAAAVCGAASLGADHPVRAVLPLAENMVSERSLRPGDVVVHPDGRRTEVLDTDSEGRLVLADGLAYLAETGIDAVVDVGTLTDGGSLGHLLWGCWGNDPELVGSLVASGEASGDPGWALPLRREYRRLLGSDVADIANTARDVPDTAIVAATYLATFADRVRWSHIDNGSTAYLDSALEPLPRGATGSPTRALLEFLLRRSSGGSPK
ncbi:MAG TPA: leucyl aminopeptidase family protein [Solirubrobacteraceae bacterium]|nr:leucyl aminopeptidase family protein [Solirubrobacteraceae bacterium]